VWEDFVKDFEATFTDRFFREIATEKLMGIKMEDDDLEGYIATFGGLLSDAEWGRSDPFAIERFYKGLERGLCRAILERLENRPANIDQLMNAARDERSRFTLKRLMRRSRNRSRQGQSHRGQTGNQQNDDIASSDGDILPLRPLTVEDRKKLKAEGRCFRCRQKGHVTRHCPKGQEDRNPA